MGTCRKRRKTTPNTVGGMGSSGFTAREISESNIRITQAESVSVFREIMGLRR